MSKGHNLLNAVAGAMDRGAHPMRDSEHSNPKRPYGGEHLPGKHDGDGDGDDNMAADHQMGMGEKFGIDELEQHLCQDCHDNVKKLASHRGGQRGEHG